MEEFMGKFIKSILTICFFLSFSAITVHCETITIGSNGNASPGWSKYSKNNGYILHIVEEAFNYSGIEIEIIWLPWKRAFENARKNKIDSTCCWFYVEERTKDFYYSDPVVVETQVFFHLKSYNFNWKSIDDLKGIIIGGDIGFNYGEEFEEAEKSGKIVMKRVPSYGQNLKKLIAGRIQLYPAAPITAYDHMRSLFPSKTIDLVTYHPKQILKKKLHLIISNRMEKKRAFRLLTLFNEGLNELFESGKYDEILEDAENGEYKKMDQIWMP